MEKLIELLGQRRVWAAITGVLSFVCATLKIDLGVDIAGSTDVLLSLGSALGALLSAMLAAHSYISPKK